MSLRDQLLQTGIATKKQHQQARTQKKRDKASATIENKTLDEIKNKQLISDKSLNKKLEEARAEKALDAQVRQLIDTHKIVREEGDEPYRFTDNKNVKTVYFAAGQHKKIISGQIAIIAFEEDKYMLIPGDIAEKVLQKKPSVVMVYNKSATTEEQDADDPYADYEIPDDLMW